MIKVADDGIGLPDGFDTTRGGGLGMRMVRSRRTAGRGRLLDFVPEAPDRRDGEADAAAVRGLGRQPMRRSALRRASAEDVTPSLGRHPLRVSGRQSLGRHAPLWPEHRAPEAVKQLFEPACWLPRAE